jgi:SAM-dependent methyltransferase
MMDRNVKLWLGLCLALGVAMLVRGSHPGALATDDDPTAWGLMAAAGTALAAFAVAVGVALAVGRRRLGRIFATNGGEPGATAAGEPTRVERRPYTTLFLASFTALFVEVMLIRYTSSQIHIFAFYKNVPLVAAFLGLGLGCCLGRGRARHALLFLLWMLPLAAALAHGTVAVDLALSRLGQWGSNEHILGVGGVTSFEGRPVPEWAAQLSIGLFCVVLLAAVSSLFTLLGRLLGDAFERVPRLPGYTANLLGSLAGILAFVAMCYLETPPWVWFAVGLLPLLWWAGGAARSGMALALVAASSLTVWPSAGDTHWSRYQKLVGRVLALPRAEGTGASTPAYLLRISDVFYQWALDLRPEAIAKLGYNPYPHYDLAYRLAPSRRDRVLIVGAGTGNDAAAALRAGVGSVDAVDIDDEIVRLGRLHHPEHPYDDRRVHVIIDDARRAFRRLPESSYDIVVFGLLDSHTQLGISSVRLDNYVFTLESLAAARRLLRPGGSLVITAVTLRTWLRDRFAAMLSATCDTPVVHYRFGVGSTYVCQVEDPTSLPRHSNLPVSTNQSADRPLLAVGHGPGPRVYQTLGGTGDATAVLPTDDWPFLYLPFRQIPRAYLVVVAMLALASVAVLKLGGLELGQFSAFHGHLFFLGAAFLLMEVYAMNRLALLFGTTWLVSAVTIAVVLVLVVAANLTVELAGALPIPVAYCAIAVTLVTGYLIGPSAVLGTGTGAALLYALVLLAPVYFAGLIFSRSFSRAAASGPAIGVNILGSVVGGWVEYSTMIVGIRGLALLALALYLASWLMQLRSQRGSLSATARDGSKRVYGHPSDVPPVHSQVPGYVED